MTKHLSIDLETLDNTPTAAIIQIGAVIFDPMVGLQPGVDPILKRNIIWKDALKYGTCGGDTLRFWMRESDAARESVMGSLMEIEDKGHTLKSSLNQLSDFIEARKPELAWAHATFDFPVLQFAYKQTGIEFPIHYRKLRDLRTLAQLKPVHIEDVNELPHDALCDALYQAKLISASLRS